MRTITPGGWCRAILATLAVMGGAHAAAAIVTIDVSGADSVDFIGDSDNFVMSIDLNAALGTFGEVTVDGIGWNVGIETVGNSWLSEARISLQDTAGVGWVDLAPGIADTLSGAGVYDSGGIVDLVGLGLSFTLADGILVLEFFDSFDNLADMVDASWSGSLQISATGVVPLPGGVWLLASGLALLAARGRR